MSKTYYPYRLQSFETGLGEVLQIVDTVSNIILATFIYCDEGAYKGYESKIYLDYVTDPDRFFEFYKFINTNLENLL